MGKVYEAGLTDKIGFSADISTAGPWDTRDVTDLERALYSADTWKDTPAYAGMKVTIKGTPYIYVLKQLPATNSANWERQLTYSEFADLTAALEERILALEQELKMDTESLVEILEGGTDGVTEEVTTSVSDLADTFLGY